MLGSEEKELELRKKERNGMQKGCKKESSPDPRNKSDRVQMAADCKKIDEPCKSVNGKIGCHWPRIRLATRYL